MNEETKNVKVEEDNDKAMKQIEENLDKLEENIDRLIEDNKRKWNRGFISGGTAAIIGSLIGVKLADMISKHKR